MQDNELILRSNATDLTATFNGSYVDIPQQLAADLIARIIVPSLAETNDKIVATFTYSDDGTNAKEVVTLPDITKANVDLKMTEYGVPLLKGRLKVKVTLTITDADAGADFNAGKVLVAIVPAGRYTKRSYE